MTTLAQNLNAVMQECGFQPPDSYIGNPDQNVAQIVALAQVANLEIQELGLQLLHNTWALTLTSATTYDLPTDFVGFVPNTMYQHGRWDQVDLPTTPDVWAMLTSIVGIASLPVRARIYGNVLHIINPTSGATINAEYLSNGTILPASGFPPYQSAFLTDNDNWRLDDRLFQLEVKWRFKQEKGLPDWQVALQDAANRRNTVRARETGNSSIVPNRETVTGQPYANLWVA
jgi:hypothetical protein